VEITLRAEQAGEVVHVRPGDTIVVDLEENLSTGYSWEVDELDESVVERTASTAVAPTVAPTGAPSGALLGAAGRRVLTFTARAPGDAGVRLALRRPWEGGGPPARTLTFPVSVTAPQP
jgi:predicted secreted protein